MAEAKAASSSQSGFNFKQAISQMVQRNASDLLLKVGRPPTVRLNGELHALEMPPVKVDSFVNDGDIIHVGKQELEVWHTPGHTDSQLSFRLGDLLLSGDNIYRDGCVGAIDAHHGSDIPAFIKSLQRIRASDVQWLLPSHGPIFRKDNALIDQAIKRLDGYLHMADFGTCAIDWPLMDEWDEELAAGKMPQ